MKSRVDESDADNPQEAPSGAFGEPADEADSAPADPLAAFFGVREQSARTEAVASTGSKEKLAALFARYESPQPAIDFQAPSPVIAEPAPVTPGDGPIADDLIEVEEADAIDPDAGDASDSAVVTATPASEAREQEPAAVHAVEPADATVTDAPSDAPETAMTDATVADAPSEAPETAGADATVADAPADAPETAMADASVVEIAETIARRRSEAAESFAWIEDIDGSPLVVPPAEDPSMAALDELFARHDSDDDGDTGETGDMDAMAVAAPERDQSLVPAIAAGAASTPEPSYGSGSFAPPRTARRGLRGALFGSRARMITSVTASVLLIAALVAGVVYGVQTVASSARLSEARTQLESAEAAIASPTDVMASAYDTYDATAATAKAMTDSAVPALAAVAGMTDQAALDAANAASAALVAGLASEVPPPPPAEYVRADIDVSDIEEVAAAEQSAIDHAGAVLAAINATEKGNNALRGQVTAFETALDALVASLPATAAAIAGENPLAEQSFRDAVVAAADATVAARASGHLGDAELLAYAAAVTALRADQVRAVEEAKKRPVIRPRSGNTTPTTPTTPTPTPTPTPTTPPAPEPSEPPPPPDPAPTP